MNKETGTCPVIPPSLQSEVLKEYYDGGVSALKRDLYKHDGTVDKLMEKSVEITRNRRKAFFGELGCVSAKEAGRKQL